MPQRRAFAPMPMSNPNAARTGAPRSPMGMAPAPQPLPPAGGGNPLAAMGAAPGMGGAPPMMAGGPQPRVLPPSMALSPMAPSSPPAPGTPQNVAPMLRSQAGGNADAGPSFGDMAMRPDAIGGGPERRPLPHESTTTANDLRFGAGSGDDMSGGGEAESGSDHGIPMALLKLLSSMGAGGAGGGGGR